MGLLRGCLELVQVRESADDGLQAELVGKAFRLNGVAEVEGEIDLIQQAGGCKEPAEECGSDITWQLSDK